MIIVANGIPLKPLMDRARVDVEDVLAAARRVRVWNGWSRSNMP